MRERELREALRGGRTRSEQAAQERAWALVASTLPAPEDGAAPGDRGLAEGRPGRGRRARRPRASGRLALVAAAVLALVAAALTPPGEAVADWLERAVRAAAPAPEARVPVPPPAPGRPLPGGGGSLLASGTGGVTVVTADGPERLLGAAEAATWSPRGRFVAAARAAELIAVDRAGRRRWALVAPGRVRHPRWAPSGFRVAYLAAGRLRVVAGDGTGHRELAPARTTVAPAWRPAGRDGGTAPAHRLAHVERDGRVAIRDADSGRLLGRSRAPLDPRALAWTGDGSRLLVIAARRTIWLTPGGTATRFVAAPRGATFTALAAAPWGRAYAQVVRTADGVSQVQVVREGRARFLLGLPGPTRGLHWSPRGTWLAIASPAADAWLLLRPGARGLEAQRAVEDVVQRAGNGRPVVLEGWCCAR